MTAFNGIDNKREHVQCINMQLIFQATFILQILRNFLLHNDKKEHQFIQELAQ